MDERHWVKRFAAAPPPRRLPAGPRGRDGRPGDPVEVLSRPPEGVTVSGAMLAYYGDADLMRRLLDAPGLDPKWEDVAVSVLGRSVPHESAAG